MGILLTMNCLNGGWGYEEWGSWTANRKIKGMKRTYVVLNNNNDGMVYSLTTKYIKHKSVHLVYQQKMQIYGGQFIRQPAKKNTVQFKQIKVERWTHRHTKLSWNDGILWVNSQNCKMFPKTCRHPWFASIRHRKPHFEEPRLQEPNYSHFLVSRLTY